MKSLSCLAAAFGFLLCSAASLLADTPSGASLPQVAIIAAAAPEAGAPQGPLGEGEISTGGKVQVTEMKRGTGDVLTLKFKVINDTPQPIDIAIFGTGPEYAWNIAKVDLLDQKNKKKYLVMTDSETKPLCSGGTLHNNTVKPGSQMGVWAKFQAPPVDVKIVTVEIPTVEPIEDVKIAG